MLDSKEQVDTIYRQLEGDLTTLFKLVFSHRKPITESDARLASAILRKWLIEGLLGRLGHALKAKITVPAIDNSIALAAVSEQPNIRYFLTGGVKFDGVPIKGIGYSTAPFAGNPLIPPHSMPEVWFKLGSFIEQKRLFFDGTYFTCGEIVKFTANKLGGVHADFKLEGRNELLRQAANFMTFGGPLPEGAETQSEIYMVVEPTGVEALSGLHIEIIAAATSLIHMCINDVPVMRLNVKKSFKTRLRNWFGKDRLRYEVHNLD
jgi:hypothetical protein